MTLRAPCSASDEKLSRLFWCAWLEFLSKFSFRFQIATVIKGAQNLVGSVPAQVFLSRVCMFPQCLSAFSPLPRSKNMPTRITDDSEPCECVCECCVSRDGQVTTPTVYFCLSPTGCWDGLDQPPNNRCDKAPPVAVWCNCAPLNWVWFCYNLSAGLQASSPEGLWASLVVAVWLGWTKDHFQMCQKDLFASQDEYSANNLFFKKSLYSSQHNYNSISGTPCWNTERS